MYLTAYKTRNKQKIPGIRTFYKRNNNKQPHSSVYRASGPNSQETRSNSDRSENSFRREEGPDLF